MSMSAIIDPVTTAARCTNVLSAKQVEFYLQNGYLRISQMFTPAETDELSEQLDWLIET